MTVFGNMISGLYTSAKVAGQSGPKGPGFKLEGKLKEAIYTDAFGFSKAEIKKHFGLGGDKKDHVEKGEVSFSDEQFAELIKALRESHGEPAQHRVNDDVNSMFANKMFMNPYTDEPMPPYGGNSFNVNDVYGDPHAYQRYAVSA